MSVRITSRPRRPTQAERRAASRSALLEAAARGISRNGYARLSLEAVAREAGYTRGALYHQFRDKEELALAVVAWADESWQREVGARLPPDADPVTTLTTLARAHAEFCRRDVARVAMALRVEFGGTDHPIGRELDRVSETLVRRLGRLVRAGRRDGSIPPGPPVRATALALAGAIEGAVIFLAGQAPHDEELTERAVRGILSVGSSGTARGA
jgi:AcrR family transcriptional regulator